ncbi:MAG: hypothetical protein ACLFQK_05100 [Fibrobacterota bacterium]
MYFLILLLCGTLSAAIIKDTTIAVGESFIYPCKNLIESTRNPAGRKAVRAILIKRGKGCLIEGISSGRRDLLLQTANRDTVILKVTSVSDKSGYLFTELRTAMKKAESVRIIPAGEKCIISGIIYTKKNSRLLAELKTKYPGKIISAVTDKSLKNNVKIEIKLIEVDRSSAEKTGIEWSSFNSVSVISEISVPENITEESRAFSPLRRENAFRAALHMLAEMGAAEIISCPSVVCRSGGTASFRSGGEIPYPFADQNGSGVQFREYGANIFIKPVIENYHDSCVSLDIKVSHSGIDYANAVSGLPAIKSRQCDNQIYVRSGTTVYLAGILHKEKGRSKRTLPVLGRIPVLGRFLFGYSRNNKRTIETIILITPSINREKSIPLTPELN